MPELTLPDVELNHGSQAEQGTEAVHGMNSFWQWVYASMQAMSAAQHPDSPAQVHANNQHRFRSIA